MIKIKYCQNGAMVELDNNSPILFEFDEEDKEGLVNMLYEIVNHFDASGKYDKERIKIELEHGSRYVCEDKNCEICRGKDD